MTPTTPVLLALLGFGVGAFGTLVGAGGGFILTPVLLLVYPHSTPALLTAISLVVVFFNASSGIVAYSRQRRVDYRIRARLRRLHAARIGPGGPGGREGLAPGLRRGVGRCARGELDDPTVIW